VRAHGRGRLLPLAARSGGERAPPAARRREPLPPALPRRQPPLPRRDALPRRDREGPFPRRAGAVHLGARPEARRLARRLAMTRPLCGPIATLEGFGEPLGVPHLQLRRIIRPTILCTVAARLLI